MYKIPKYHRTNMKGVEKLQGEPIELKLERILNNNEPITDGAPEIFTDKKDGVKSAYNIRTDRWEIATEAMDKVEASKIAKKDAQAKGKEEKAKAEKEAKVINLKAEKVGEPKSTNGTSDS